MTMEWGQLLVDERFYVKEQTGESWRSQYQKDYDRIVFSGAFRRLGRKTQVHPLALNDHIHNRLTHSLEVSVVGRSLGLTVYRKIWDRLGKKLDVSSTTFGEIVQAACLSHDIGNPPFGHAGEDAIQNWFRENPEMLNDLDENERDDFLNFEGNAQSFRIVTRLEHHTNEGGMRLTFPTLASMLKYPWTSLENKKIKKFSCFQSEKEYLKEVAEKVGMVQVDGFRYSRHPLAYLAEAADDICYRILDIEDAHEMKILTFDEILKIFEPICCSDDNYNKIIKSDIYSPRRKISYLRGKTIGVAIDAVSDAFVAVYDEIMEGRQLKKKDLIEYCRKNVRDSLSDAKKIAANKVFDHARKVELEIGAYTTIGVLLESYIKSVREVLPSRGKPSFRSQRILKTMGINAPKKNDDLYESMLRVTDYISGMTDSYATYMAKQVGGMAL